MDEEQKLSLSCPLCDSDVPAEPDTKPGDTYYCSYCKMEMKVIKKSNGKLTLEMDGEE